eukprot:SAG31_NODE_20999_length_560_cov_0.665944_1_plen_78_part_01
MSALAAIGTLAALTTVSSVCTTDPRIGSTANASTADASTTDTTAPYAALRLHSGKHRGHCGPQFAVCLCVPAQRWARI